MLACEPVAALALAREAPDGAPVSVQGAWRGETARLAWSQSPYTGHGTAQPEGRRIA
jgi:hypothetical protein